MLPKSGEWKFINVLYCRKPKTQKAKRELEKKESKIFENDKMTNFIKGGQTSELVSQVLKELVQEQMLKS